MADEIIDGIMFQKGFNHGYYLEKDPKGRQMLQERKGTSINSSYDKGLQKGIQEAQREQFIEQGKTIAKDRDRER